MPFGRILAVGFVVSATAAGQTPQAVEHFEKKVRPVLVAHCLECHGGDSARVKGGLRLTSRAEMLRGGDSGLAVVPGDPEMSRLVRAVRQAGGDLKMPPKGRLKDAEIADLETWVKAGAVWPNATPTKEEAQVPGQLF